MPDIAPPLPDAAARFRAAYRADTIPRGWRRGRHAGQHHRFITREAVAVESARDFRALLFPPMLVAFVRLQHHLAARGLAVRHAPPRTPR